jgi:hypothetical protein
MAATLLEVSWFNNSSDYWGLSVRHRWTSNPLPVQSPGLAKGCNALLFAYLE